VVAFGVSPQSASSHAGFSGKHKFPFPLLVDAAKNVADLYKCGGLILRRTVYLIGPDGKIRFARRGMPSPDEVIQQAVLP
jgi:peroxiredoxin Q/BCP